ncbi:MAG TPA: hypothetical protein VIK69_11955 [Methylophilaceae bacterium]
MVQIVSLAEYARAQAASYYDQNDEAAIAFRHIANCIDDAISKAYEAGKEAGAREYGNVRGEVEYEYEVWQDNALQAGGRETDYASAQAEAEHYAMMYAQDGLVEVRIYEKRLLSVVQQTAEQSAIIKRRPYNASGSLSEYGVFPESDAQ